MRNMYALSLPIAPHISRLGIGCERKANLFLGEESYKMSDPRVSFEELDFF